MIKFQMNCGYCGRKCDMKKDLCVPQDSVYVCKTCYDWSQKVADLEAKLAESENRIEELESQFAYECECNKQFVECQKENDQLKQQLAEWKDGTIICKWTDAENKVKELEQQLAEKDKTIDEINKEFVKAIKDWKELVKIKEKNIAELEEQDEIYHNQDKIELLEILKETFAWGKDNGYLTAESAVEIIDQKIKEIKGE